MLLRTYKVHSESNQLRGMDAATLITVVDQHNIVWADVQISRDEFDSIEAYRKAINDKIIALRETWKDEHTVIPTT